MAKLAGRFSLALTGGTFDRRHRGHEALLSRAFEIADEVCVGITSNRMASRKTYPRAMQPLAVRRKALEAFLRKKGWLGRARIAVLSDIYGPDAFSKKAGAIVATAETRAGAGAINAERKKRGLAPAKIILCKFVRAEDGKHISSTRVRLGQIDEKGRVFLQRNAIAKSAVMPRSLATHLRKPFGTLFGGGKDYAADAKKALAKQLPIGIATVGDECFGTFKKIGRQPGVAIVDCRIRREERGLPKGLTKERFYAKNPAGTITSSLADALKKAAKKAVGGKPCAVVVAGEEDLAVIPAVLSLPLGWAVFYGQPKKGIVRLDIDEDAKNRAAKLLSRFTKKTEMSKRHD